MLCYGSGSTFLLLQTSTDTDTGTDTDTDTDTDSVSKCVRHICMYVCSTYLVTRELVNSSIIIPPNFQIPKYLFVGFSNFTFYIKFQFSPCCWFFLFPRPRHGVVLVILGNEIAHVGM